MGNATLVPLSIPDADLGSSDMVCHDYTLCAWFLQASNRSTSCANSSFPPSHPIFFFDMGLFFGLVGIWITYPSAPFQNDKKKTHKHKQLKQVDSCSYH